MEVVATATNRADALAAAAQHQPDVVLVDIDLGGDCGVDLLQELLRQCDAKPIMFSGVRESELHERAVLQGARGVVHKTDATDVILKAIASVHRGEVWLDRAATARVFETLRTAGAQTQGDATPSGIAALTQKERAVVVAVIEHKGAPSKVIAAALHISPHTLRNHLATIYSKLDVRNRMDLLMYAHEHGLHPLLVASLSSAVLHGRTHGQQPDFVAQVRRVLELTLAYPTQLTLELTETQVLDNVERTIEIMQALKSLGVGFSMDDFGTGYSSLSYLRRLPLDQLKIDRSFVLDLVTDSNDAVIVRTIIGMAKNLGLDVLAEGVETEAQLAFLCQHGCCALQGYLFSPPLRVADFGGNLRSGG